ncbi:MAG: hypothetical protein AAGE98_06085 [Actinomycetota bacterium]
MPVQGHAQCAHCGALLSSDVCSICGKGVHEAVTVAPAAQRTRELSDEAKRQIRGFGVFVAVAAVIGVATLYVMSREEVEPTPTALALPATTTTVETAVEETTVVTRPDADVAPLPTLPVTDSAERDIGGAVNPWNGAPPLDVLTGDLLENTDYEPGMRRVAEVLADEPVGFVLGDPRTGEWNGVDLAAAETAQPFAARGVSDETGPVTDLWVFARGSASNDGSAVYFADARERWPIDDPLESYSPRPGIRIHRLADDGDVSVWVDLRDTWMVVYRPPIGVDPALLGAISETWG